MMRKAINYFLYTVAAVDDLPPAVGAAIKQHLTDPDIEMIIVIPPQDYTVSSSQPAHWWQQVLPFNWRHTPQRTLAFGGDKIVVVETLPDSAIKTILIPLDSLIYAEFSIILLYAYVEFAWAQDGQVEKLKIEFHAVGDKAIQRVLEWARTQIAKHIPRADTGQPGVGLPFKFKNYLKYSLLPGERVLEAVYQPAIRRGEGWFQPDFSPNRAVAVTQYHLIVLEEELQRGLLGRIRSQNRVNYGIILRYCPLRGLRSTSLDREDELTWLRLRLGLAGAELSMDLPLAAHGAVALQAALEQAQAV